MDSLLIVVVGGGKGGCGEGGIDGDIEEEGGTVVLMQVV